MDVRTAVPAEAVTEITHLIGEYRDAQTELRRQARSLRGAEQHAMLLRMQLEAAIQEKGLDTFRAVYVVDRRDDADEPRLRRVAAGRNLRIADLLATIGVNNAEGGPHGGTQTPACTGACDEAMREHDTQNMVCVCDCLETDAGQMTVITCVSETGTLPE